MKEEKENKNSSDGMRGITRARCIMYPSIVVEKTGRKREREREREKGRSFVRRLSDFQSTTATSLINLPEQCIQMHGGELFIERGSRIARDE